jgi:uncharacterized protein (TIGR02145 family)
MKRQTLLKAIFAVLFLTTFFSRETLSQQMDTLKDSRDGKIYKTVIIGKQTWMAENLNYKTPNDSWCYNDDTNKCKKFGRLYNWETANAGCPSGWHLPSQAEFDSLAKHVGGSELAGARLKSNAYWRTKHDSLTNYEYIDNDGAAPGVKPDSVLINSYNFNGLPGGTYFDGDKFDYLGIYCSWWTSSKFNQYNPYYYYIYDQTTGLGSEHTLSTCGFSVRCVKN